MSYIDIGFDKTLYRINPNQLVQSAPLSSGSGIADSSASSIYNPITDATPAESISSGTIGEVTGYGKKSFTDTTAGYRIGLDSTDKLFKWIIGGTSGSVDWNVTAANTLTITGSLSATSGTIGGWAIGATTLTGGNAILDSTGNLTLGTGDDIFMASADNATYRSWIGNVDPTLAPYSVTKTGGVTMSNVTITGGTVATSTLNVGLQAWTTDIVFTSASATQINWTSGHIRVQNGTTWNISSGNTGAMGALTYIYFDTAVSVTALQTTTTYSTATGDGKILIATAQNNTVGASVIPMGGSQPIIDGTAQISALSITASSIAASTITAAKMNVTDLSAISANIGTITAGSISVVNGGNTVGFTPNGTNALFSGPTGAPTWYVTPAGVMTATGATVNGRNFNISFNFGDGSDGAVVINNAYSPSGAIEADTDGIHDFRLKRDAFFTTFQITDSKKFNFNGFRMFCQTSFTGTSGSCDRDGYDGAAGVNGGTGVGQAGVAGTAGSPGAGLTAGTLCGTVTPGASSDGGAGGGFTSVGNQVPGNSSNASNGTSQTITLIGIGKNGALGGAGGAGANPGGTVGTIGAAGSAPTPAKSKPFSATTGVMMIETGGTIAIYQTSSSCGGSSGGGGGNGTDTSNQGGGGGGGAGGAGSPGGIAVLASKSISIAAGFRLSCNGGSGGKGGDGGHGGNGGAQGGSGGGGGGGGSAGNGGVLCLIYQSYTNAGTVSANAGTVGAKGNKGLKGTGGNNNDGLDGNAGTAGTAGVVIQLQDS